MIPERKRIGRPPRKEVKTPEIVVLSVIFTFRRADMGMNRLAPQVSVPCYRRVRISLQMSPQRVLRDWLTDISGLPP